MKAPHTPPWWESASPDELHHRQSKRLNRFLRDRVVPFGAHYRRLFERHGLSPREMRSTDDLVHLPFTSKRDLTETRNFVLIPDPAILRRQASTLRTTLRHGPRRARELLETELRPIFTTSTTGRSSAPVPFLYTQHDLDNLASAGRRLMLLGKSDPSYRHVNVFPFAPHLAFWLAHYAGTSFNTFVFV